MSRQADSNQRPADYKSAALPTELCRRLRGKILSDAAPANLFLYAFSIRQLLTPLKASFWTRPEHTGRNSHRFAASAMTYRLRALEPRLHLFEQCSTEIGRAHV